MRISDKIPLLGELSPSPTQPSNIRGELSIKCNTDGNVELDQERDEHNRDSGRLGSVFSSQISVSNVSLRFRRQFQSIKEDLTRLVSNARSATELEAKLNSLDRMFVVMFPLSYILFLIIMFTRNHAWEDAKVAEDPDRFAAWIYRPADRG